jgi:hypothetical protein
MKRVLISAVLGWFLVGSASSLCAEDKNSDALIRQIQKESNPRKQANLARQLIAKRLDQLHARIANGTMLQESSPQLTEYAQALEMLGSAVRAADHAGTTKSAEQLLRDQIHELDNLKMNVSSAERPFLVRIAGRAEAMREEFLHNLMHPPEESGREAQEKTENQQK